MAMWMDVLGLFRPDDFFFFPSPLLPLASPSSSLLPSSSSSTRTVILLLRPVLGTPRPRPILCLVRPAWMPPPSSLIGSSLARFVYRLDPSPSAFGVAQASLSIGWDTTPLTFSSLLAGAEGEGGRPTGLMAADTRAGCWAGGLRDASASLRLSVSRELAGSLARWTSRRPHGSREGGRQMRSGKPRSAAQSGQA
jgi:hypothetical protein